ncbi:MAG: radical SAM protein [Bacteriovoracaceae bacterium]|jgi:radical SAM protein with 4Fe4S-binding SPASM domain|nr:radical SAM protein [Bacteriovoracaceae bacterium]
MSENTEMENKSAFDGLHNYVDRIIKQMEYSKNIKDTSPLFPQHVHIEPTNACNLQCIHCHHHPDYPENPNTFTRKRGIMKMELYKKVINEIAPLKCSITLDVQGEPTLHPKFMEMVRYAKERNVYTSVLSNGTKLTEKMSMELIELGLDRMVFSFDSVKKEIYEKIRIKSKFDPTFKNVLTFIKLNHEAGHKTHVCMSMVYQKRNKGMAQEYEDFFAKLPVDKVFCNPLLNLAGVSGISDEIELSDVQKGPKENWPICRIPWEDLTVNWDGLITPCPVDVNVSGPVGDANEDSLQEIWNNENMRSFRRAHIEKDYTLIKKDGPLCESCNCLFYPEYDLRDFGEYATNAICRSAMHYAPKLINKSKTSSDEKFVNLQKLLSGEIQIADL